MKINIIEKIKKRIDTKVDDIKSDYSNWEFYKKRCEKAEYFLNLKINSGEFESGSNISQKEYTFKVLNLLLEIKRDKDIKNIADARTIVYSMTQFIGKCDLVYLTTQNGFHMELKELLQSMYGEDMFLAYILDDLKRQEEESDQAGKDFLVELEQNKGNENPVELLGKHISKTIGKTKLFYEHNLFKRLGINNFDLNNWKKEDFMAKIDNSVFEYISHILEQSLLARKSIPNMKLVEQEYIILKSINRFVDSFINEYIAILVQRILVQNVDELENKKALITNFKNLYISNEDINKSDIKAKENLIPSEITLSKDGFLNESYYYCPAVFNKNLKTNVLNRSSIIFRLIEQRNLKFSNIIEKLLISDNSVDFDSFSAILKD